MLKAPQETCRVASVYARFGNVFGHDRAGPNYRMITNGDWQDGRISANTDTIANLC